MNDHNTFQLDPRLAAMSVAVGRHADIEFRLVDDTRYHWLMLVPAIPDIIEVDDLPGGMAANLFRLAGDLGSWLKDDAKADKINIAMIGNVVPQMHVHIVARHIGDAHWPDPIWGRGAPQPMTADARAARLGDLIALLNSWG